MVLASWPVILGDGRDSITSVIDRIQSAAKLFSVRARSSIYIYLFVVGKGGRDGDGQDEAALLIN